jgi:hypothetical protein
MTVRARWQWLFLAAVGCGASSGGALDARPPSVDVPALSPDARASSVVWTTDPVDAAGVSQVRFASAAARTEVSFHVFIPEAYETSSEAVPVL